MGLPAAPYARALIRKHLAWNRNKAQAPTLADRRLTMKVSRILSAVFVLLALAGGTLATSACTSATDSGASSTSGGSSSGGGY
jgi:uncharacterized membrane protein YgcG